MMDEKQLEREYRSIKQQAAPDLWNRIEGNLKEHPEREAAGTQPEIRRGKPASRRRGSFRRVYGMAAAAAALAVLVTAVPVMRSRMAEAPEMAGGILEETRAAGNAESEEDGQGHETAMQAPGAEAGPGTPERETDGQGSETAIPALGAEAGPGTPEREADGPGSEAAIPAPGAEAGPETLVMGAGVTGGPEESVDGIPEMAGDIQAGAGEDKAEQMAYRPLQVPEDAVTVAEDARYFSEGILADTDLLCGARVISAELCQEAGDTSGQMSRVVYQMEVDGIYYAEDYIRYMDQITVESPIIRTQGDTAFVLYQLVPGETYLLPLAEKEEHYELLYPFAPQIQMVQGQGYLFHSGYASLVNDETAVARKEPEGDNDFYYDRMLLRNDDNFLSDLISLIEREK